MSGAKRVGRYTGIQEQNEDEQLWKGMTSSDRPCAPHLHPGGFHEEKVTAAEEGRNLAGVPPPVFTLRNLYVFCLLFVPFGQ